MFLEQIRRRWTAGLHWDRAMALRVLTFCRVSGSKDRSGIATALPRDSE
jgi:hypothetical protein